ncbi:ParA family protein [Shimia sp. MMG029]|uniref:ParA family protein n=1 Tax=Shimia sp. MMG029 TaxID=3021978 RepID=UPI0022FE6027|nr:ParA family protein [Shimia sp. MMG029]MDA5558166.1 ParA family protein [Shimia sp. MMG029]
MPTLSFCSPKGGTGKPTTCILVALEVARSGKSVAVLDTDPKRWLSSWADLKDLPDGFTVHQVEQQDLTDATLKAVELYDYVLIDVEGSDDASLIDAVLVSDLVVVPTKACRMDAPGAVQVLKQVRQKSLVLNRNIAARVLMTQTEPGAVEHRITGEIGAVLRQANAPVFITRLANRPIFQAMVSFGGDYLDLPRAFQGSAPQSAHANVAALANEIAATLSKTLSAA